MDETVTPRTRPFQETIPLVDARAIIEKTITPIARVEWLQLHEAIGRVLAHDIAAGVDVPPFARAAMDGYALRAGDTAGA
jgi:molybdopterin biosynthesis enzyme